MKKVLLVGIVSALLAAGCQSEQEKQLEKNKEVCEQQIKSGAGATPYCLDILPNYKGLVVQGSDGSIQSGGPLPQTIQPPAESYQQPTAAPAPVVQYVPTPSASTQPVIVNQDHGNGFMEGFMGGMVGSMIGNSGSTREIHHYSGGVPYGADNRPVTINKTYNVTSNPTSSATGSSARLPQSIKTPAVTATQTSKNYMDTSKLGSVGTKQTEPTPKTSGFNTSKFKQTITAAAPSKPLTLSRPSFSSRSYSRR